MPSKKRKALINLAELKAQQDRTSTKTERMLSEPELFSHQGVLRNYNPSADNLALNKTDNEIRSMIGQFD